MAVKCEKCNVLNSDTDNYCIACGQPLKKSEIQIFEFNGFGGALKETKQELVNSSNNSSVEKDNTFIPTVGAVSTKEGTFISTVEPEVSEEKSVASVLSGTTNEKEFVSRKYNKNTSGTSVNNEYKNNFDKKNYKVSSNFIIIIDLLFTRLLYSIILVFLFGAFDDFGTPWSYVLSTGTAILEIVLSTRSVFRKRLPEDGNESKLCVQLFFVYSIISIPFSVLLNSKPHYYTLLYMVLLQFMVYQLTILTNVNYVMHVINKKRKVSNNEIWKLDLFALVMLVLLFVICMFAKINMIQFYI